MPVLHLVAGPNGAGKSTYVEEVLRPATSLPVINADVIAAARWPGQASQAEHAYEAARIAESERREHLAHRRSFITETVFSHDSKVTLLEDAVSLGYLVHLHVVMVPVELTVLRVSERVLRGGHAVPEEKIRQRYERLWGHVARAIRIADQCEVLDNSRVDTRFRLCATYAHGALAGPTDWPKWAPLALQGRDS